MNVSRVIPLLLFFILSCTIKQNSEMADLIIINAKIWTSNPDLEFAEAMAVKGDTILALGSNQDIEKYKTSDSKVIDNNGKLILPGFIDSHLHFLEGGFSLSSVQLKDAASKAEFISSNLEVRAQGKGETTPSRRPASIAE